MNENEIVWVVKHDHKYDTEFFVAKTCELAYSVIVKNIIESSCVNKRGIIDEEIRMALKKLLTEELYYGALTFWEKEYGDRFGEYIFVYETEMVVNK